jgi:hypothetical protein
MKKAQWLSTRGWSITLSVRSAIGRRTHAGAVSLVFLSTTVPNGTVFEFSESADSAAHDLKGDALHTLWGAEGMLLAGAA